MAAKSESRHVLLPIITAIGGLLTGVAAVLGLFIVKPQTINVLVPVHILRQAVAAKAADQAPSAARTAAQAAAPTAPTPSPVATKKKSTLAPPHPSQNLGQGLKIELVSLAEDKERFIATVLFANSGPTVAGVAILKRDLYEGELILTDSLGGSCVLAANGEMSGTLSTEVATGRSGSDRFQIIAAGGKAQDTIFFNKGSCQSRIAPNHPLSMSGSFVVNEGGSRRVVPIYFGQLSILHREQP